MRRLATVRARTTAAAVVVFAAALALGGVALVLVVQHTMTDNVDTTLRLRAADVGSLLAGGAEPSTVAIVDEETSFVQIVSASRVVAASNNVEGEEPVLLDPPGRIRTLTANPVDDAPFRVLVETVDTPSGPVTVIVGNTLETVEQTVRATVVTLATGLPLLVALGGVTTWVMVGRALGPVESIRSEVAEIGATDLHRRVPRPATDDEIGRLARTMNEMLDRIESGTLRQRRFVSDASHELRTPIATIRHELEVALDHPERADWPALAEDVLDEDLRMQRMVDDLLWLARHDQLAAPDQAADLVDLDEVAAVQARRQPLRDGVTLDLSGIGAGQVRGSPDDLTRVVQNLVDNAARHATSRVAVTVESGDGEVRLHVDDDGIGVPPDRREEIFERFTRIDEARNRDHGGAGLGLAIARDIAADHGGTLVVGSAPLGGARFTLTLTDARLAVG